MLIDDIVKGAKVELWDGMEGEVIRVNRIQSATFGDTADVLVRVKNPDYDHFYVYRIDPVESIRGNWKEA